MSKRIVVVLAVQFAIAPAIVSRAQTVHAAPARTPVKTSLPAKASTPSATKSKASKGEKRDHHRHQHDSIPSFRSIRQLESLTAVQKGKINKILKDSREESMPLARRLRTLREETYGEDISVSKERERSPESMQLRKELHAIKKYAWQKMQGVLTARQKAELLTQRDDDRGPRRRNKPDERPMSRDSGKSFSK